MKRKLFLSLLIVFFTTSFISLVGCNNQNSTKEQYQLQEQCGKRCEEVFKNENGNGTINDKEQIGTVSYHNHYNKKMNKCFILLDENGYKKSNDKIYKMKSLLDVNEKKKYGFFYNFGTLTFCDVLEKKCKSEEEWNLLVKPYMKE
jgi:hypothetical protein